MFTHYRTKALVLKKKDRGEGDQLFTLYTQKFGKIEVLGRGIRKITSKLKSGVEIFYLSEVEFIQGKGYKTLTDAIVLEKFQDLRSSLAKLKTTYRAAETVDRFIKGEEKDERIWRILLEFFYSLDGQRVSIKEPKLLLFYFLWHFFVNLGYEFQIYNCAICERKLAPGKLFLNSESGGVICENCTQSAKGSRHADLDIIKILKLISKKDKTILNKLKTETINFKELGVFFDYFLTYLPAEAENK